MQLPLSTLVLGLAALGYAAVADIGAARLVARNDLALANRANGANGKRPTPSGQCCVANTSLNQDTCKAANGQQGRCVPGGNNCKPLKRFVLFLFSGPPIASFCCVAMANVIVPLFDIIHRRQHPQLRSPVQSGLHQQHPRARQEPVPRQGGERPLPGRYPCHHQFVPGQGRLGTWPVRKKPWVSFSYYLLASAR